MSDKLSCITCKRRITNVSGTAKFLCPQCGKYEIIRCKHCRQIAAPYECSDCKFIGPN
jgi:Zn-ribbon RNA-binding protein